ncbi:MAG: leucine-rich repeat domain-containing protein [Muribaculaceae bacterium]|nr:leucine-rich repeat domain-containing protein [Muribaculaceae bacterium]
MNTLYLLFLATLAIQGNTDIRSLLALRDLDETPAVIDLSEARINEYTFPKPAHAGMSHFAANTIPQYIFFRSPYQRIILPIGITTIENGAFSGAEITTVDIPEGVTTIGDYAFYGCTNLTSVSLPSTLRHIGTAAFAGCTSLPALDLSKTAVTDIPDRCFSGAEQLEFLRLPLKIESVGTQAFSGTGIKSLSLPNVTKLAPYALTDMPRLEQVILNKDARYAEGTLMNNASLSVVSGAPANLPPLFAANCVILSPSGIIENSSTLGEYAFANSRADQLILAPSVNYIAKGTFSGTSALSIIYADALLSSTPDIDPEAFQGVDPADITLHVAENHEEAWRMHPVWSLFNISSETIVGVDTITADTDSDGLDITLAGNTLLISASSPITSASIFSIDGRLITTLPDGSDYIEYPLDQIEDHILIIQAATPNSQKTTKILK